MDVAMIKAVAESTVNINKEPLEPSSFQIDTFNKMMSPNAEPSSDNSLSKELTELSKYVDSPLKNINIDSNYQFSPEKMLATQRNIVQSVVEVELAAKLAGSASQAINKLTSIQ